jgi:hypothetical protein
MSLTSARSWFAVGAAVSLATACASRGATSGALEPRYVAIHNALAAMGLAQVGGIHEGSLAQGQEARIALDLAAGCTTIVTVGGEGIRDIDASVVDAKGRPVAHDTTSESQAVLRACVDSADTYVLVVRAVVGAGSWVATTWTGSAAAAGPAASGAASTAPQAMGTCEAPIPLTTGTVTGTTVRGESNAQGSCEHTEAREIVYELDVPRRQRVALDLEAHFDSVLYIRKDECDDEGSEVDCNDDAPGGGRNRSRIERVLDPGKYFVFVDGYNLEMGPYKLTVSTTDVLALSDACRRAPSIGPGALVSGTTAGLSDDAEASCGGAAQGADAPWRFELASRSRVRLVEHSDDVSPVLHVRYACVDADSEAACGEATGAAGDAVVTGVFDPATYTVFADARESESAGRYTLSLETAPPDGAGVAGDGCGDALALLGATGGTVSGDTFSARDDLAGSCSRPRSADVVYRVDLPRRSRLRASLLAQEAPHVLVAWSRCGDRASEVACGSSLDEILAPGTYFLGVEGATAEALGRFSMVWTAEDLGAQAAACVSPPRLMAGHDVQSTTAGAGDRFATECGGRDSSPTGADRVFRMDVTSRSRVRLVLTAPTFDASLALRRSCVDGVGVGGGAQLACETSSSRAHRATLDRELEAGTYWVVVDGQSPTDEGPFRLEVGITPVLAR